MIDNYMSETVMLDAGNQTLRVGPHDRIFVEIPVPVCEDEEAFRQNRLELRILAKDEKVRLWEAGGQVRCARDGAWRPDAEAVPKLPAAGGRRGIVVGAMGGFWFKQVNV
jgi:hypothetical protein